MIGNHLLEYREMKEHQAQLLEEGQRSQLLHSLDPIRPRPVRVAVARFGTRLEAFGRRLQAFDGRPAGRH